MSENVYVYECIRRNGEQVLVAFHDDHIGQNHDEPTGEMLARIPIAGTRARITHIITEIGQTEPRTVEVPVARGRLRVRLSEYPVFIEPMQDASE